jgi:hypothetical protein
VTLAELRERICAVTGATLGRPRWPRRALYAWYDCSRAQALLAIEPTPAAVVLTEALAWFLERDLLDEAAAQQLGEAFERRLWQRRGSGGVRRRDTPRGMSQSGA